MEGSSAIMDNSMYSVSNPSSEIRPCGSRALLAVVLIAFVPWAFLVWKFNWLTDDSFISFRYAKNLAAGFGLRYNIGTQPPVEGFSNFLWNVWLAFFEYFNMDVTVWSRVTSICCSGLLLIYVIRFVRSTYKLDFMGTLCTALFFATLPPVVVWSSGGLETIVACLLLFTVYERLLGNIDKPHGFQAGIAAILLGLIREEGFGFISMIIIVALLTGIKTRRKALVRETIITSIMFGIALAGFIAWRYSYYGNFVSNTARLKGGFSLLHLERGFYYIVNFFLSVPSCALVLVLAFMPRAKPKPALAAHSSVIICSSLAFAVYAGGDFMAMGRFLVPIMPFLAILFAGILLGIKSNRFPLRLGLAGMLILLSLFPCFDIHPVPQSVRDFFDFRWGGKLEKYHTEYAVWKHLMQSTKRQSNLGKALKQFTKPGESITHGAIGAMGYYSDLYIYDLAGLVNREVAMQDTPPKRDLPAHDRDVSRSFFLKYNPTYLFTAIIGKKYVENIISNKRTRFEKMRVLELDPHFIELHTEIVFHPLKRDDTSGDESVLLLVRYMPDADLKE
jgi:hypothetical protein